MIVGVKEIQDKNMTMKTLFTLSKIDSKWWVYYGMLVLQVSDEHVVYNINLQIVFLNIIIIL